MNVRFLVFTDLHVDIMPDAVARMEIIARAAREREVDFVVQLGDLQYPEEAFLRQHSPHSIALLKAKRPWALGRDDEKLAIRGLLSGLGMPVYSVIGNHDLHVCAKETMCRYWDMPAPYYSFCAGGVRFIVLDTNWVHTANGLIDLAYENGSLYPGSKQRYLSQVQLAWLQQTLRTSAEPCVLLSHASLVDPLCGIHNPQALAEVLDGCAGKVILALNGHSHVDGMTCRRDTAFVNINSASYHWVGDAYAAVHYSRQLCSLYPQMANTVPYYHPLYAVVTIADGAIRIDGTQSCFVGPSPQVLGLPAEENDYPPTPCISHRLISLP